MKNELYQMFHWKMLLSGIFGAFAIYLFIWGVAILCVAAGGTQQTCGI